MIDEGVWLRIIPSREIRDYLVPVLESVETLRLNVSDDIQVQNELLRNTALPYCLKKLVFENYARLEVDTGVYVYGKDDDCSGVSYRYEPCSFDNAFCISEMEALEEVVLPDGLTHIGPSFFTRS